MYTKEGAGRRSLVAGWAAAGGNSWRQVRRLTRLATAAATAVRPVGCRLSDLSECWICHRGVIWQSRNLSSLALLPLYLTRDVRRRMGARCLACPTGCNCNWVERMFMCTIITIGWDCYKICFSFRESLSEWNNSIDQHRQYWTVFWQWLFLTHKQYSLRMFFGLRSALKTPLWEALRGCAMAGRTWEGGRLVCHQQTIRVCHHSKCTLPQTTNQVPIWRVNWSPFQLIP